MTFYLIYVLRNGLVNFLRSTVKYQIVPAVTILFSDFQVRVLIEGGHYSRAGTILSLAVFWPKITNFTGKIHYIRARKRYSAQNYLTAGTIQGRVLF